MTTTDGYSAETDVHIPVVEMTARPADTTARPPAGAAPRPATRQTAKRKPLPRKTVAMVGVAGAGAAAVVVAGLAVAAGPVAALAAALGIPMTVAARMMSAGKRRTNRRTTRRPPGADRRRPDRSGGGGMGLPRLPKMGSDGGAGRTKSTGSRGPGSGVPKKPASASRTPSGSAMHTPGLPNLPKKKPAGPGGGEGPKLPKATGPRTAANGGRTPKGGPRPASDTVPKRDAAGNGPAGTSRRTRRRKPSSESTSGASRRNRNTPEETTTHGSAGIIPYRRTRKQPRVPRTRFGHAMQQKRLADQEKYIRWLHDRPGAVRQSTRRAVTASGKAVKAAGVKTVNGMGSTGRAATAGFKADAKPGKAARAAYRAARDARRPGVRGHAGSIAAGVVGAGLAAGARGTANRAVPVGRAAAKAGRAAAKRYRKVRRLAARRSRNFGKRLLWVFTANTEALRADRARAARREALTAKLAADRKAATRAKYAAPRPQQAQPAAVQRPAPATVQATASPAVTTNPRPQQATPIVVPAHVVGTGLTGGSTMSHLFPPYAQAVDLGGSLYKWSPGDGEGALFALYDCLPAMRHTAWWIHAGWHRLFNSVIQDLNLALNGTHIQQQQQVQRLFHGNITILEETKTAFERIHGDDLKRRALKNAQVTNVDGVHRGDVNRDFQPWHYAEQYGKALMRWRPGIGSGALFHYFEALPHMSRASWFIANGWSECMRNTTEALRGGLDQAMGDALTHVYRSYVGAAEEMDNLLMSFHKAHEADLQRRARRGAHTANIPVRVN